MDQYFAILAILGTMMIGAMTPGPSFIVVARVSLARSRREGVAVALGMGLASATFTAIALGGLHFILEQVPWAYLALKVLGGGYLVFLAFRIFRGSKSPMNVSSLPSGPERRGSLRKAFALGFLTQISNPKTAVVFASVFATFLTVTPDLPVYLILVPLIYTAHAGWYSFVALALSSERPRRAYGRAKTWIDRCTATVMGTLGASLVGDAATSID